MMLWYVRLCYVMVCCVMLSYVILCHSILYYIRLYCIIFDPVRLQAARPAGSEPGMVLVSYNKVISYYIVLHYS